MTYQPNSEFVYFDLDDMRKHHYSIPEKTVVFVGEGFNFKQYLGHSQAVTLASEMNISRINADHSSLTLSNFKVPIPVMHNLY